MYMYDYMYRYHCIISVNDMTHVSDMSTHWSDMHDGTGGRGSDCPDNAMNYA